ncbi:hypothetical protein ONZ45_g2816 [Pleurotus djamor]|nr:hypothetical protein ONZ45_g2816 [Pleurotus djamor]
MTEAGSLTHDLPLKDLEKRAGPSQPISNLGDSGELGLNSNILDITSSTPPPPMAATSSALNGASSTSGEAEHGSGLGPSGGLTANGRADDEADEVLELKPPSATMDMLSPYRPVSAGAEDSFLVLARTPEPDGEGEAERERDGERRVVNGGVNSGKEEEEEVDVGVGVVGSSQEDPPVARRASLALQGTTLADVSVSEDKEDETRVEEEEEDEDKGESWHPLSPRPPPVTDHPQVDTPHGPQENTLVVDEGDVVDSRGRVLYPDDDFDEKPTDISSPRRASHLRLDLKVPSPQPWELVDPPDPRDHRGKEDAQSQHGSRFHSLQNRDRSLIPKSSYYFGPPPPDSAYGTRPIGQIGVHHPREILRIERDYTGGELTQFAPIYPLELESRITPTQFLESINAINEILISAHSLRHSFFDSLLAILSLQLSRTVATTHYEKEMKRLRELFDYLNANLYNPVGLNLLWPRKVAFLFLEIEYY